MSGPRVRTSALVMALVLILPVVVACTSAPAAGKEPAPGDAAGKATVAVASKEPTKALPAGKDLEPSERVANALGILLGVGEEPAAFSSYHLEVKQTSPHWDRETGGVKTTALDLQADVQGENLRLISRDEAGKTTESYLFDETEYEMVDGKATEMLFGGVELAWALWPLEPTILLSVVGLGASPQGSQDVEGRKTDVFALDLAKADPATMAMFKSFINILLTEAKGKIWIDQETGALVRVVLDCEQDIVEPGTQDVKGHGAGHLEISVTQVGKAQVSLPG